MKKDFKMDCYLLYMYIKEKSLCTQPVLLAKDQHPPKKWTNSCSKFLYIYIYIYIYIYKTLDWLPLYFPVILDQGCLNSSDPPPPPKKKAAVCVFGGGGGHKTNPQRSTHKAVKSTLANKTPQLRKKKKLLCNYSLSWCLMSSDVIWHIRDKLWPMPKHGSIKSTYVRCMRV